MTTAWAIDTGITRNASALARVKLVGLVWQAWVWKWQGSTGDPLSIEHTVAPEAAKLWRALGCGPFAADGYYIQELRKGLGSGVEVRVQGGTLRDVYHPTKRLVEGETDYTLSVSPVGWIWTGGEWEPDPRSGERVTAGIKALESENVGGQIVVSLPESGQSHHDEAVAVMRALWHAGAGKSATDPSAITAANLAMRNHRAIPTPLRQAPTADLTFRRSRAW